MTLSFYESSCELYLRAVNFIRWNYVISRSDARRPTIRAFASKPCSAQTAPTGWPKSESALGEPGGLVSLLDYSEGDISLTSKICAIAPEALTEQLKASIIEGCCRPI